MRKHRPSVTKFLIAGARRAFRAVRKDYRGHELYGFVLTPVSGFTRFAASVAVSGIDDASADTELSRAERDLIKKYPHAEQEILADRTVIEASRWKGYGQYGDEFGTLNRWLDRHFDSFYEDGYEPEQIDRFFESVIVSVFRTLKTEGEFKKQPFASKLVLGSQHADPSDAERVIRISSKLSSKVWHDQVVAYYEHHI